MDHLQIGLSAGHVDARLDHLKTNRPRITMALALQGISLEVNPRIGSSEPKLSINVSSDMSQSNAFRSKESKMKIFDLKVFLLRNGVPALNLQLFAACNVGVSEARQLCINQCSSALCLLLTEK